MSFDVQILKGISNENTWKNGFQLSFPETLFLLAEENLTSQFCHHDQVVSVYTVTQLNSLWPNDISFGDINLGQHSTLAQVMTWCLTSPSHYLNQFWLIIKGVLWIWPESNITASVWAAILHKNLKIKLWNCYHISQGINLLNTQNEQACMFRSS